MSTLVMMPESNASQPPAPVTNPQPSTPPAVNMPTEASSPLGHRWMIATIFVIVMLMVIVGGLYLFKPSAFMSLLTGRLPQSSPTMVLEASPVTESRENPFAESNPFAEPETANPFAEIEAETEYENPFAGL